MVQSKSQLWRFIEEIGIAPLLAALKKTLTLEDEDNEDVVDSTVLRTEAVEAIYNLMNVAMDLVSLVHRGLGRFYSPLSYWGCHVDP